LGATETEKNKMNYYPLWLFLHVVGIVVWVGGMFFAYTCLRPAAAEVLEPPLRLTLWQRVFARFFPAVWVAVGLILLSGFALLLAGGVAGAPHYRLLMMVLGLVMSGVFVGVVFGPFRRLSDAVAAKDWPAGAAALGRIRQLVAVNLTLAALTIAVATLGRWF
jgi:uncharacterized membrane protein